MEDIVVVRRLITYQGPRDKVEKQLESCVTNLRVGNGVKMTGVTLSPFPEVVTKADEIKAAIEEGRQMGIAEMWGQTLERPLGKEVPV